jgi:signal peptidase II
MIWFIAFFSGLFLVSLDQLVKYWARIYLQPLSSIDIIQGFFSLSYVENNGAAFGLLQGWRWVFIPLTVIVVAAILIYYGRLPRKRIYWAVRVPMLLIISGALGNFIDRLRFGYVVDMFEFRFITFPVFNVADICLVCGTIAFVIVTLFVIKEEPKRG